jgi:hypothetical protein
VPHDERSVPGGCDRQGNMCSKWMRRCRRLTASTSRLVHETIVVISQIALIPRPGAMTGYERDGVVQQA